jgi:hypothetical protein
MFRKCPSYRAYLISWRDVRMLNSERDGLSHGDNISCEGQSPSQRDACALRENEMARPPKAIKRDRQISIRFTGTELDEIDAHGAAAGTTLSEFGRTRMLAKRNAPARDLGMAEALQEQRLIHIQLSRVANLLNQLVPHMHQAGEILPDVVSLLQELRTIISGRGLP